jgi:DNA-binding winged helix-turn-helix (wHTH) protein
MSAHPPAPVIRSGAFEVNFQTGELRHKGQKVKLQEQQLQILAALLERPGEIVTLWSEDTFADFDHSLNAAVKRLRDALGESAGAPVFIETLARRGYRFIAPVELAQRIRLQWTENIAKVAPSALPHDLELRPLSRTRRLLGLQRWLFGFGIFFIALSLSNEFSFADGRLKQFHFLPRDYPIEFGIRLTLGLACWIAYFSIVRRLRTS